MKKRQTWEFGSLTDEEIAERGRLQERADNYSFKTPWNQTSVDEIKQFEDGLNATDYQYKAPWLAGSKSTILPNNAENYKFQSLWAPEELSDKKASQIKNYKYNPPFECDFNKQEFQKKNHKKPFAEEGATNTMAPWKVGTLPADKAGKHIFPKAKTGFWDVPEPETQIKGRHAMPSSGDPILDSLRDQLKRRGANGIMGLARKFKIMDDDSSGFLQRDEFEKAMKECEIIDLSQKAISHLFLYFDTDDSGTISYDEFLIGIRGELNQRRKSLVLLAFRKLDKDGSGLLTIDDLKDVYDVRSHPDFTSGKATQSELLLDFLSNFLVKNSLNSAKIQQVTEADFLRYYGNLSASVDDDDYFELMIRNAWHISGGQGWSANSTNRRALVTNMQTGEQTVEEVEGNEARYNNSKSYSLETAGKVKTESRSVNPNATLPSRLLPQQQYNNNNNRPKSFSLMSQLK